MARSSSEMSTDQWVTNENSIDQWDDFSSLHVRGSEITVKITKGGNLTPPSMRLCYRG